MMSNEEAKTTKTIRDFPINKVSPFNNKLVHIAEGNSFSVNISPKDDDETSFSRSLTGIHYINKKEAIDLMGDVLKDKLGITKGSVNVFKYLYEKLEKSDGLTEDLGMNIKVDFDDCKDACGYTSTQSVWYALAELLDKDIIARSLVPAVYFLNPNFFQPVETIVVSEYYKIK